MEWFILAAPVPATVEFNVIGVTTIAAMLLVAFAPVALAIRHALGLERVTSTASQLRVVEGGKEISRRAA